MTSYDFSTLSPQDFELLTRDLFDAEFGWKLEAFGAGRDGGVDLRGTSESGKIVVQCKHYIGSSFSQLRSAMQAESVKMEKEAPQTYLLATSQSLSKTQKDTLFNDLKHLYKSPENIFHNLDLNALLTKFPKIEQNHFKLWLASSAVLTQIVHSGLWARSEALLEDIQSRVKLYVTNPSYQRAADVLAGERVVIISGVPGVGKSLLAEMLLLTHWNEEWQVIQVGEDIEEAWNAWKPEAKQIFYYDDFLGQTNFSEQLGKNEDSRIVRFAGRVKGNSDKRLIFTTRTQVLRQAELLHELLQPARLRILPTVIQLSDYSLVQKARILYNHLYFSELPRQLIKDFAKDRSYLDIITHPNYSPRIIELLSQRSYSSAVQLHEALKRALDNPILVWGPSFESGLSDLSRRLLLSLVTYSPSGVELKVLTQQVTGAATSFAMTQSLKALETSWITLTKRVAGTTVAFANPSCRDYLLSYIDSYPSELDSLIESIVNVMQIDMILGYASSNVYSKEKRATPRYKSIREHLPACEALLRTKFDEIWDRSMKEKDYDPCVNLLALLTEYERFLGPNASDWLCSHAETLFETVSSTISFGDCARFAAIFEYLNDPAADGKFDPNGQFSSTVMRVLTAHGNAIETREDYEQFLRLEEDAPTVEAWVLGATLEAASGAAIEALISEIGVIKENSSDAAEMSNWLSEISSFAERYGLLEDVTAAAARLQEEIDELDNREPSEQDLGRLASQAAFEEDRFDEMKLKRLEPEDRQHNRSLEQISRTPEEEVQFMFQQLM